MIKTNIIKLLLAVVVLISLFLRVVNVANNPPSLTWDEVSIGYNAWSILKTGRDEHGRFMPVDTFIAYGDYKPPLSVYLTVPFVALFGLNDFSVRLPSVISGTITVLLTYFLVSTLFKANNPSTGRRFTPEVIGLIASLVLALSPWHIMISRAGFEANIALMFVVLGVYLVALSEKKPALVIISLLPFVVGIYTFNSTRYFVPLLGLLIVFINRKHFIKYRSLTVTAILLAFIALIPLAPHLLSTESRLRYKEVNIFTDARIVEQANERIAFSGDTFWAKLFANRRSGYFQSFLSHYFDHFTADFLFIKGDGNPKFSIQDTGQLYIPDVLFLVIGIFAVYYYYRKIAWLLTGWLLFSIIPAATARETPHALRILNSLPVWQIFIAFGLVTVYKNMPTFFLRKVMVVVVVLIYLLNIGYFLSNYHVHYPRIYSGEWQYGYRDAIKFIVDNKIQARKVHISNIIGRPYMYTLFYTGYDPAEYVRIKQSYFDAAGFYHVAAFGRYEFLTAAPQELVSGDIYIFPSSQVPDSAEILYTVKLLDGNPVLSVFRK